MKSSFTKFAEAHLEEKLEKIMKNLHEEPAHFSPSRFRWIISPYGFKESDSKPVLAILKDRGILSSSPTRISRVFNEKKPFSASSHPAKASNRPLSEPEKKRVGYAKLIKPAG